MEEITSIKIRSVADFINEINKLDFPKYKLFRGENKYYGDTKLCPKIGRIDKGNDFSKSYNEKHEIQLLNWFKSEVVKYLENRNICDLEYMFLGQHHGLATRLLDFTLNPLVALYFAVEDKNEKNDGYVYVFDELLSGITDSLDLSHSLESLIGNFYELERDSIFIVPTSSNNRINSQSGVFCLMQDPSVGIKGCEAIFTIPDRYKLEIKAMLFKLNIHKGSLFQDLDSLCDTLNYRKFDYNL